MATLASHNLLRLKTRDSYTPYLLLMKFKAMSHCYKVNSLKIVLQAT